MQGEGCGHERAFQWCRWWGEASKCRECRCHSLAEEDGTTSELTEPELGSPELRPLIQRSSSISGSSNVQAPCHIREPFRILEALLPIATSSTSSEIDAIYIPRQVRWPPQDLAGTSHEAYGIEVFHLAFLFGDNGGNPRCELPSPKTCDSSGVGEGLL